MKTRSEGFEQTTRSWIHGSQHHCDFNLSPFGGLVENTYTLRHVAPSNNNILKKIKKNKQQFKINWTLNKNNVYLILTKHWSMFD